MAVITTNSSPKRLYTPYTGLSATERAQSGIARAEVVYYVVNEDWPAPGTGNNRVYQIPQTTLPKDFGYVLTDVFVNIHSDTADYVDAQAIGHMRIFPGGTLGPQINLTIDSCPTRAGSSESTPIGDIPADEYNTVRPSIYGNVGSINYQLSKNYTGIIYPFDANSYTSAPNPGSVFDLALSETPLDGNANLVSYYVRFLQYDIDQSYNYVIQSPQLTR